MLPTHATFPNGGFDFEAGISAMAIRLADGKLRVARHLHEWFGEYRMYHRGEDGLVNKINDDLISATRILCMSIRRAAEFDNHRPGFRPGMPYRRPRHEQYAAGSAGRDDINPWTGRDDGAADRCSDYRRVGRSDFDPFSGR
jgi:hypothetical protein